MSPRQIIPTVTGKMLMGAAAGDKRVQPTPRSVMGRGPQQANVTSAPPEAVFIYTYAMEDPRYSPGTTCAKTVDGLEWAWDPLIADVRWLYVVTHVQTRGTDTTIAPEVSHSGFGGTFTEEAFVTHDASGAGFSSFQRLSLFKAPGGDGSNDTFAIDFHDDSPDFNEICGSFLIQATRDTDATATDVPGDLDLIFSDLTQDAYPNLCSPAGFYQEGVGADESDFEWLLFELFAAALDTPVNVQTGTGDAAAAPTITPTTTDPASAAIAVVHTVPYGGLRTVGIGIGGGTSAPWQWGSHQSFAVESPTAQGVTQQFQSRPAP